MKKNFIEGVILIFVILIGLSTISCKSDAQRLKEAEEKVAAEQETAEKEIEVSTTE